MLDACYACVRWGSRGSCSVRRLTAPQGARQALIPAAGRRECALAPAVAKSMPGRTDRGAVERHGREGKQIPREDSAAAVVTTQAAKLQNHCGPDTRSFIFACSFINVQNVVVIHRFANGLGHKIAAKFETARNNRTTSFERSWNPRERQIKAAASSQGGNSSTRGERNSASVAAAAASTTPGQGQRHGIARASLLLVDELPGDLPTSSSSGTGKQAGPAPAIPVWTAGTGQPPAAWFDCFLGTRLRQLLTELQKDIQRQHRNTVAGITRSHARLLAVSSVGVLVCFALDCCTLVNQSLHKDLQLSTIAYYQSPRANSSANGSSKRG